MNFNLKDLLDGSFPEMGGNNLNLMLEKLFPNMGRMILQQEFVKIQECAH